MHTHSSLCSASIKQLQSLKNTRVFVAGDVILDSYIEGKVTRISPEAPVPVLLETGKKYVPGGAGNVAANIASFGAYTQICARIGNDAEAVILKEHLESFGVNTQALVTEDNIPTTSKTRVVSYHEFISTSHQVVRLDREVVSPLNSISIEHALNAYREFIAEGGQCALIISDYGKGFLTPAFIQKLIQLSNVYNIPVITDPKSIDVSRYKNSTVIKPNLSEGRHLSGIQNSSLDFYDEVEYIAKNYLTLSECQNIVMSLSQRGIVAMGKDIQMPVGSSNIFHLETKALQVADVSGAGDTLIAFLAMGLAAKLPLPLAIEVGNLAAGIVCGKPGTAVVKPDELFAKIQKQNEISSSEKLLNLTNLTHITKTLQNQNKKIVFTNGCFDILHAGHVEYLQKAKSLGDVLVIGLNSDNSIKRLKGPSRPVQTFDDRAQILAALGCVDFVIEFDEDTPLQLILSIKPDLLVKGSDYNFTNTVGAQEVLSWGGHVEHIALLAGRSTTAILDRI